MKAFSQQLELGISLMRELKIKQPTTLKEAIIKSTQQEVE